MNRIVRINIESRPDTITIEVKYTPTNLYINPLTNFLLLFKKY